MQIIPILVVDDVEEALDFYTRAFRARVYKVVGDITAMQVQDQAFGVRRGDEDELESSCDRVRLVIETAAPEVLQEAALNHGAEIIEPVDYRDSGVRAGRFIDPFGFQWTTTTPVPR